MSDLLSALTVFDWITPVVAEIQDIVNGPNASFVYLESSASGKDIFRKLKRKKINPWGWIGAPFGNEAVFTVREKDAPQAYKILLKMGVVLTSVPRAALTRRSPRLPSRVAVHVHCDYCDGLNDESRKRCEHCGARL